MPISLRDIATFIDPVEQPISLRDTVLHHRWVGDQPVFSSRTIARRHTDPDSVVQRFLSYNTYLMRVRIGLAKALADFAGPGDVLKALDIDPGAILKRAGKKLCNVAFPGKYNVLRPACKAAGDVVGYILDHVSPNKALEMAFEALGAKRAVEFMLELYGVPDEITLEKKPALSARSVEIGDTLKGDRYDLAALCEVWTTDVRDPLLDHWGIPRDSGHLGLGKGESNVYVGDGLLLGSREGRIVETQQRTYSTRGIHRQFRALDLLADDELFAQKGVMLARLDMGVGTVDLYMTHLYFGTGLLADAPWWVVLKDIPGTERPNNEEREAVRSAQLTDLSKFIGETHRVENIAMVCGDFNIDATGNNPDYAGLLAAQEVMNQHNLVNVWISQRGQDPGGTGGDFNAICKTLQAGDDRFCADPSTISGGYRIDYILMERPQHQHSFMLDVTRVRRRPFKRQRATDGETFMSDHLGLDCSLLASRK